MHALKGERNDDEWTREKDRQGKIVEGGRDDILEGEGGRRKEMRG